MQKPNRTISTGGQRKPSAARTASGTGSTNGGVSGAYLAATSTGLYTGEDLEITAAPPVSSDNINLPLTKNDLKKGWKVITLLFALTGLIVGATWWVSHLSIKVDQHEDDLKEVKVKTDKLLNDSAVASSKLQKMDSQVDRLENKMFDSVKTQTEK